MIGLILTAICTLLGTFAGGVWVGLVIAGARVGC